MLIGDDSSYFFGVMGCLKDHDIEAKLSLTSSELNSVMTNAQFANGFGGCTGENKSPQLGWRNVPEGTKSFVVTIFDRDVNSGVGFNHWLLIDIPASVSGLLQDTGNFSGAKIPAGSIQTQTDAQVAGYVGVCPLGGETHHYEITVYALNVSTLGLTDELEGKEKGISLLRAWKYSILKNSKCGNAP